MVNEYIVYPVKCYLKRWIYTNVYIMCYLLALFLDNIWYLQTLQMDMFLPVSWPFKWQFIVEQSPILYSKS